MLKGPCIVTCLADSPKWNAAVINPQIYMFFIQNAKIFCREIYPNCQALRAELEIYAATHRATLITHVVRIIKMNLLPVLTN